MHLYRVYTSHLPLQNSHRRSSRLQSQFPRPNRRRIPQSKSTWLPRPTCNSTLRFFCNCSSTRLSRFGRHHRRSTLHSFQACRSGRLFCRLRALPHRNIDCRLCSWSTHLHRHHFHRHTSQTILHHLLKFHLHIEECIRQFSTL